MRLMDDLIKRQDAIDEVNNHRYVFKNKHLNDYEQGWNDACDYCADEWLEQLPSAQQWIPCSERLPEEPGRYMVTDKYGDVRFAMYSTKIPMWWGGANQPTAWMPLPEAYKEVRD